MRKGMMTAAKALRRWRRGHGRAVLAAGVMFAVLGLGTPAQSDSLLSGEQTDAANTEWTGIDAVEPTAPAGEAAKAGDDVSAGTDGDGTDGAGTKGSPPGDAGRPKLNMASLEEKLRATGAIGFFTKLELKGQVDDLIELFRAFHDQEGALSLGGLRQRFNLLLLKVLTLLQDSDPGLSREIGSSRLALWQILSNPAKFAQI